MFRRTLTALHRRLAPEDGATLIAAVGVSAGMMLAGTSVINLSTLNQHASARSSADTAVSGVAEAGLASALAVVSNPANNPADGTLLPPRTTAYSTGDAEWSGAYDRSTATWTLTSTGSTANPAAVSATRARTMSTRVRVTPVPTRPLQTDAWDYLYTRQASSGGTCDVTLNSGVTVTSPLFVSGNLCLSSNAAVAASPLVVKGRAHVMADTAWIGTVSSPLAEAHIASGCKYLSLPVTLLCSPAEHVYSTVLDQTIPAVTPPTANWDLWFRHAAPGPYEPCTAWTGTPPVFDNDVTPVRNNSVPTIFSLTPAVSYSCRVGPADEPLGELSWDAAARRLTVQGTVFIDGSVKVDNGLVNTYVGKGALYVSGTFLITNSSTLCAVAAGTTCDFAGWDPRAGNAAILTVVANGNGGQVTPGCSIQLGSWTRFQGMLYSTYVLQLSSNAQTQGGIVAWTIMFGSGSRTYTFPALESAPTGTPGAETSFAQANPPEGYSG